MYETSEKAIKLGSEGKKQKALEQKCVFEGRDGSKLED